MNELDQAIKIVRDGGIIIFPTDTAFGIGCRVDREDSVRKLFEMRRRPSEKAMPVLFDSIKQVKDYVLPFDKDVENLMNKYWPGALTIILNCKIDEIPDLVRGGGDTLGVRVPDHDLILELIKSVGVPLIGTSANFAGRETPFGLKGLDKDLIKLVDFVLEGKTKGRRYASTVIDVTKNPWKIIRQGEVVPDL